MADLQVLKKLLAEEYGITTARELDEAMKKNRWIEYRRVCIAGKKGWNEI